MKEKSFMPSTEKSDVSMNTGPELNPKPIVEVVVNTLGEISNSPEDQSRIDGLLEEIQTGQDGACIEKNASEKKSEREIDPALVWVVLGDSHDAEKIDAAIKETLGSDINVQYFYRDYNFESAFESAVSLPRVIIADGTCGFRDEEGDAVTRSFDFPGQVARAHKIALVSPRVMGMVAPFILKMKLKGLAR